MSWPRLFGVRSGVYLYTVYAGNTARLHAPHHPHSVDRALHKLGPSYPHQHPKPRSAPSIPAFTPIAHEYISSPPYAIQFCPRGLLFATGALRQSMQPLPIHRSSTACVLPTTGCARKCSAAWVSDSESPRAIAVGGKH
ncbi:hypothetical protein B0H14DRAFT_3516998 [Mycena olivaceomarginata]|nr:hypothetical protein B0H14DRAFT_3516998 [Mycena olivaceomarginata]